MRSRLFKLVSVLITSLVLTTSVFAQTASPTTTQPVEPVDEVKDLKFPIEDLGGCGDYKSCLTYCDDPVNNAICIDFAKKNGFYKDDPVIAPTDEFLTKAKDVLGCDSAESCATLCSDSANHDKCDSFAKSQGVLGGYVEDPDKPEFLDKAKEVLGCSDATSCSAFCDNSANADKCDQFADQVGLLGGQVPVGPGGCNTEGTCGSYCSDPANFDTCKDFTGGGGFSGPGGCNSKETCRTFCEENPADCRSYAPGSNGVYVPAVCPAGQDFGPGGVCTATDRLDEAARCAQSGEWWSGTSCSVDSGSVILPPGIHPNVGGAYYQPRPEMGNCSTPGSCYDFCKENPGKCGGFDVNTTRPKDGYIPSLYYTPGTEVKFAPKPDMGNCSSPGGCYDFCKENPGKCGGFDDKSPRPMDTYMPGTYYTPPIDQRYYTPPITGFYVTPMYYTPPAGSDYTTPSYYTPGIYSTPSYYTPSGYHVSYITPTYYSPGTYYPTPANGQYPTPSYTTPHYYTPPILASYNTPSYYTPPTYTTPNYYTPPAGSNYTTPTYHTPPAYTTPQYYTPYTGGNYTTPTYYTPPAGSTYTSPAYYSPSGPPPTGDGSYSTPYYSYPSPDSGYTYPTPTGSYSYPTPSGGYGYPSPSYGTPSYGTPESYPTPSYNTPSYGTPEYSTPSYGTPESYPTPEVHGASTVKGLLEQLWDFITGQ